MNAENVYKMSTQECCVEVAGNGGGQCMLVVVPLPALLGKGNGLGEDRGPKRDTEICSPEQRQTLAVSSTIVQF